MCISFNDVPSKEMVNKSIRTEKVKGMQENNVGHAWAEVAFKPCGGSNQKVNVSRCLKVWQLNWAQEYVYCPLREILILPLHHLAKLVMKCRIEKAFNVNEGKLC